MLGRGLYRVLATAHPGQNHPIL